MSTINVAIFALAASAAVLPRQVSTGDNQEPYANLPLADDFGLDTDAAPSTVDLLGINLANHHHDYTHDRFVDGANTVDFVEDSADGDFNKRQLSTGDNQEPYANLPLVDDLGLDTDAAPQTVDLLGINLANHHDLPDRFRDDDDDFENELDRRQLPDINSVPIAGSIVPNSYGNIAPEPQHLPNIPTTLLTTAVPYSVEIPVATVTAVRPARVTGNCIAAPTGASNAGLTDSLPGGDLLGTIVKRRVGANNDNGLLGSLSSGLGSALKRQLGDTGSLPIIGPLLGSEDVSTEDIANATPCDPEIIATTVTVNPIPTDVPSFPTVIGIPNDELAYVQKRQFEEVTNLVNQVEEIPVGESTSAHKRADGQDIPVAEKRQFNEIANLLHSGLGLLGNAPDAVEPETLPTGFENAVPVVGTGELETLPTDQGALPAVGYGQVQGAVPSVTALLTPAYVPTDIPTYGAAPVVGAGDLEPVVPSFTALFAPAVASVTGLFVPVVPSATAILAPADLPTDEDGIPGFRAGGLVPTVPSVTALLAPAAPTVTALEVPAVPTVTALEVPAVPSVTALLAPADLPTGEVDAPIVDAGDLDPAVPSVTALFAPVVPSVTALLVPTIPSATALLAPVDLPTGEADAPIVDAGDLDPAVPSVTALLVPTDLPTSEVEDPVVDAGELEPAVPSVTALLAPVVPSVTALLAPVVPSVTAVEVPAVPSVTAQLAPVVPSVTALEVPAVPSVTAVEVPAVPSVTAVEVPAIPSVTALLAPVVPSVTALEVPAVPSVTAVLAPADLPTETLTALAVAVTSYVGELPCSTEVPVALPTPSNTGDITAPLYGDVTEPSDTGVVSQPLNPGYETEPVNTGVVAQPLDTADVSQPATGLLSGLL